ncbi:MAG: flagellar assembly factor FliW [Myxococcota bacterium]|jgi:flagellar assembly factor FliW
MDAPEQTAPVTDDATDLSVLTFDDGLPGFTDAHQFVLVDLVEDGAFQLLRSLDHEGLELVVGQPWLFFPDYAPEIADDDQTQLSLETAEDALIFCAVTLPEGEDSVPTMNLLGPFVVNRHTLAGRQVVLRDEVATPVRAQLDLG